MRTVKISRLGKFIETESRFEVTGGWPGVGWGVCWLFCPMGIEFLFGVIKKYLK